MSVSRLGERTPSDESARRTRVEYFFRKELASNCHMAHYGSGAARLGGGPLMVTCTGPDDSWTIHPTATAGVIAGAPASLSRATASSGTPMTDVFMRMNGNRYDVLGINTQHAIVEHVPAGLLVKND